ncbi:hypothetical protein SLS62_010743 [Diatrype stigma]|uniref:Branchpoint-bridging protein n=1 Tax=Diatrype stigma TaxID=117547 RepID=A0AAN9YGF5_9PEZI
MTLLKVRMPYNSVISVFNAITSEQIDAYVTQVRIEEVTQKLRVVDIVPAGPSRKSPSPEPLYDTSGKRLNTRYRRHREHLEDERHGLIERTMRVIPNYRAPQDYINARRGPQQLRRRPMMITDRVYIPTSDFPEVNFIGQLLGPGERSIAEMNARSGANIVIHGKGSVKEGRGRGSGRSSSTYPYGGSGQTQARIHGHSHSDQQEDCEGPLHCLITADCQGKIDRAKALVQAVIETAVTTPERENERKRQQLSDLAVANGTFRDDEGHGGCGGGNGLIRGAVPATAGIICRVCGSAGHIARERSERVRKGGEGVSWNNPPPWRSTNAAGQGAGDAVDLECSRFLSELES